MTDPFAGSAAPTSNDDPFGSPMGDDPFAAPKEGGGNFGPAPRFADLGGRLLALNLREIEERQKYKGKEGELESTGIVDIGVLDGGMIFAPPAKDENGKVPFGAPMQECGPAPMLFPRRFVSARGVLSRFPGVRKVKEGEGSAARERYVIGQGATIILGRLGKLVSDKDVAKHLGVDTNKPTEKDLELVKAWLDTNPPKEQLDRAIPFWAVVDVTPEARAFAVAWAKEHPEFLA